MRHTHTKAQHRRRRLWNNTKLLLLLCFLIFPLLLVYLIVYDKLTYTRILTGFCLWSIDCQSVDDVTTFWRHLRSLTERTYGDTFHFLKLLIFLFHVILVLCRLTTNCLFYIYSIFSLGFNSFDDLLELSISIVGISFSFAGRSNRRMFILSKPRREPLSIVRLF